MASPLRLARAPGAWGFVATMALAACAAGCSSDAEAGRSTSSTGGVFPFGLGGALASTGGTLPFGGTASSGGFPPTGGATATGGVSTASSGGAGGAPLGSGGAGGIASANGGVSSSDASASGGSTTGGDAGTDGSVDGPVPVPPPTPVGCVTAAALTPGVHQVSCDTTIHVLTVPEACTKTACGVIVDVHGGMMSSQMEDKNTNLSALGVKHGYLVIQPNALQNPILLNQRLFTADAPGVPGDDTRVMNILTQVTQAFHADTKRIHMTGFSEGGFMTWRWFCKHPDMLASIAPGAAAWKCATLANLGLTPPEIGCEFTGADVPARNVPVLFMQGTKDGLVEPPCVDAWLKANVFPTLELDAGTKIAGDTTFTRTRYLDPGGVPFEYISHNYATTSSFLGVALVGHCYPGSTDLTVTPPAQTLIPPDQIMSFGCNDQTSFNWGEEVMKFFIAHPKR